MLKLHETLELAFPDTYQLTSKYVSQAYSGLIIHDDAAVTFKLQEGPVNEVGHNGIQQTEMLHFIRTYVSVLDKEKNCPYNAKTIHHINMAIRAQDMRTADRESRGVEGTSKD